jgi:hypothetical protein
VHAHWQLIESVKVGQRLHRTELTTSGDLLWGDFLCLDFGPARASKCSLQFVIIDEIHVEITNARDNRLDVYVHLITSEDYVRFFCEPSCWTLFLGLVKLFRVSKAEIKRGSYFRLPKTNITFLKVIGGLNIF